MFQFTTTNVINSKYESGYNLTGDALDEEAHVLWSFGQKGKKGEEEDDTSVLIIKRIGTFKAELVKEIDRALPVDPIKARAVINLNEGVEVGQTCRLNLYIGLSEGSNDAMYANDYWFKGKPFAVEYVVREDDTADKLAEMIKKFLLDTCDEKWLDFKGDGNILTITMMTEYQRFRDLKIEYLNPEGNHNMGEWIPVQTLEDLDQIQETEPEAIKEALNGREKCYFAGQEGFGTADYILHNLRIPTSANSRWLAVHEDERPHAGAKYVQYTIHMCADRGQLGMNAVGLNVQSTTDHVLYVREDLVDDFETNYLAIFILENNIPNVDMTYTPWDNTPKTNFV